MLREVVCVCERVCREKVVCVCERMCWESFVRGCVERGGLCV